MGDLQDLSNKLQSHVESAADRAERACEKLARRTEDSLEENLDGSREEVHKQAEQHSASLRDLRSQLAKLQRSEKAQGAQAFLAQVNEAASGPAPLALVAFVSLVGACIALFSRRRAQSVELNQTTLG